MKWKNLFETVTRTELVEGDAQIGGITVKVSKGRDGRFPSAYVTIGKDNVEFSYNRNIAREFGAFFNALANDKVFFDFYVPPVIMGDSNEQHVYKTTFGSDLRSMEGHGQASPR